jgi:aspartate/methionine/tyrosine aminotransferase
MQPFLLERYAEQYEYVTPHLLGCSDCESLRVEDLFALEPEAEQRLRRLWLGYTEFYGSPALRRLIAGLYRQIAPEQVMVHSGGEEAIFTFMTAALEPGDHLIVQYPSYQSHFEIARARGCEVSFWASREEDGWEPDLADLERLLRPNTRVVAVNTPQNPTGYALSDGKLRDLLALSREHGFVLFSDEVYGLLEHGTEEQIPSACDLDDRAVTLNVMSKSFGLGGLRIGWIATRNRELFDRVGGVKDYTTICNPAPSELLAEVALRHGDRLLARNREIVRSNLERLDRFFAGRGDLFRWRRPTAGPIAFPALTGGRDAEAFTRDLRERAGVLLLPGQVYGEEFRGHFRVGFGRSDLPAALERLEGFLDGWEG